METLSRLVFTFLLNAFWQVCLVTVLTAVAARWLQNAAARYRHALWVMGLGLAILLPLTTLPESWRLACRSGVAVKAMPRDPAAPQHQPDPAGGLQAAAQNPLDEASEGTSARGVSRLLLLDPLRRHSRPIAVPSFFTNTALSIYLLVLAAQLIRLAWAWASATRLRSGAQVRQAPPELTGLVTRCQKALGLQTVAVSGSFLVAGPATVGFFRPVIVLPETLLQAGPSGELTTALCHEMAHIRRRDYLVNLLCEFALLPLAFHPAAWLLKRRIEETHELACDEAAAGLLVSAPEYARSLVNLAESIAPLTSAFSPRYTLGVFDANILEERIMRLLDNRSSVSPRRARLLLGGATLALALAALAAGMFSLTAIGTANAVGAPETQTDFSGRWELDKAQSELPSPFPDNLVEVINQHGLEFKVTTTSKDWNTNKAIAVSLFALMLPEFSATTDNKETVQPFGPGQVRSKTHWEGKDLVTEWTLERNGQVAVTGRWVRRLSTDGNTQTIEISAHDPVHNLDGEAKAVFVRRDENPRAFLGTWRAGFRGKQFLTLVIRGDGERVTGALSSFNLNFGPSGNLSEGEPGSGPGSEIVAARLYNGVLHIKLKDPDSGEFLEIELKLVDNAKAELTFVDVPVTPGSAVPKPLILTREPAKNEGANAGGEQARRAFLGTWRGQFNGKTYIIVNLKETDGLLAGGVSVGGFGINDSGQVARVKEEANPRDAVPISNARLEGALLSFSGRTPDGGSDVLFQMKLEGGNAAELKCILAPAPPPGTPEGSWWKLVRESDDHHRISGPGPLGGIVGGVNGGVDQGVLDGTVRGVPDGVRGGVVGGVTGGI
ncbi:MAG: M56 family metallopeptidase [Terriglobia bacterium]|jgi:beta-lactamase regulating signal transducer with metallopeptidase domain